MAKQKEKIEREAREETPGINFLEPVNLSKIGTDDDPCFGKYPDLKAEECQECGDCELCQIAFSQKMNLKRIELEKETHFKDIQREKDKVVKYYLSLKEKQGKTTAQIKTRKKFKIQKETLKLWISEMSMIVK